MRKQSGEYLMYLLRLYCSILQLVRIVEYSVSSFMDYMWDVGTCVQQFNIPKMLKVAKYESLIDLMLLMTQ